MTALRGLWPQPEDTEATLPHSIPGTTAGQADPLPSAPPLPSSPSHARPSGWHQAGSEPSSPSRDELPALLPQRSSSPWASPRAVVCSGGGFRAGIMKRSHGKPQRKTHPPLPGLISPLHGRSAGSAAISGASAELPSFHRGGGRRDGAGVMPARPGPCFAKVRPSQQLRAPPLSRPWAHIHPGDSQLHPLPAGATEAGTLPAARGEQRVRHIHAENSCLSATAGSLWKRWLH